MIGKEKKVKIILLAPDKQTIDAEDEAVVKGQFMKILQQNEQKYWLNGQYLMLHSIEKLWIAENSRKSLKGEFSLWKTLKASLNFSQFHNIMKKDLEQSRFTTKVIKIHGPRVENIND